MCKANDTNEINKIYTWLKWGCYQRSLHYHNTPSAHRDLYEKQLEYIRQHYEVWSPGQAIEYLKTGKRGRKPSIIVAAFDGYRNNHDVLWKLFEEIGIHGWFLLVTDFINAEDQNQERLLSHYQMQWVPDEYADGRYAMNWQEAGEISRRHTMVNHTSTHYRLTEQTQEETLKYEILHAEELIQRHLEEKPQIFSWLGGAGLEKNRHADGLLRKNGYHLLMGYRLEYFDETDKTEICWEEAQADETGSDCLDREIRNHEQIMSNIGWYSAVPAILPFYQNGYKITEGQYPKDLEMARHFTALARYMVEKRNMEEKAAADLALDVLAVSRIGEGFLFH